MKKKFNWIWYAVWLLIVLVGGGGTLFSWMPRTPGMFYGGCAMLAVSAIVGPMLLLLAKSKGFKKAATTGLIFGAAYAAVVALVLYLCDKVIFANSIRNYQPVHSSLITVVLDFGLIVALCLAIPKQYDPKLTWLKRGFALILCGVALALSGLPQNWWWNIYKDTLQARNRIADPAGLSSVSLEETGLVENADFYVAVDGDDEGDGSFSHPFATIERARDAVRALDKTGRTGITVAIKAGDYRVDTLLFTQEDSGTEQCPITYCAYGDGEVIFNAGVTLATSDFAKVSGDAALRIQEQVRDKVVCIDLGIYGITAEDYGHLTSIGSFSQASRYDGDYIGTLACELFVNNQRQNMARYPNEGWLYTGKVLDLGQPYETPNEGTVLVEYLDLRNPRPSTYAVDKELAERMNGWQINEDIWMFGYWVYEWADSSSPLQDFNYENRTMTPKFVHTYGAVKGAPYYFYNVLEELDIPGEWYLDRETGILYLYEPDDLANAEISLSLSENAIILGENVEYLTFQGMTVQGTRDDAISIVGNNITLDGCLIRNIGGNAVYLEGYNNLVSNNEITRTGKGGIIIDGGDLVTLTPGNSRAYNNLIHDWSEVYRTYHPAVTLRGVGNLCDHNEIYNSPHMAVTFEGPNHIIEYNVIRDVVLLSEDAGAIYSYRSMTRYGVTIRYNAIYNLGTPGLYTPSAIYMDGVSGQTIYGNLLVNVPLFGIKLGSGRDYTVQNNLILNTGGAAMQYCEHLLYGPVDPAQSMYHFEVMLADLNQYDWQNGIWKETFPQLAELHFDLDRKEDPLFIGNTAGSKVTGNVLVNAQGSIGEIESYPNRFSDISGNGVYTLDAMEQIFVDPANGDYRLKENSLVYEQIPDFEQLPVEKIGRE